MPRQWPAGAGGDVHESGVLACGLLVRQHIHVQRLVNGQIHAVGEGRDTAEEVHAHRGRENPWHGQTHGEYDAGDHDWGLAAAGGVGNRPEIREATIEAIIVSTEMT